MSANASTPVATRRDDAPRVAPGDSSLGPASIAAVRAAAPSLLIDVHLYTMEPEAHVRSVAAAGADRITFQWESLLDPSDKDASAADGAPGQQPPLCRAAALAEHPRVEPTERPQRT